MHEVRLVQTLLGSVPNRDLPPETFPQAREIRPPASRGGRAFAKERPGDSPEENADLEVDVLYSLFQQDADIGQPIDVTPGSDGRIRVTGTVANPRLLARIREELTTLDADHRLDIHIVSAAQAASERHPRESHQQELEAISGEAPAAQLVRAALLARGLKGAALQSEEQQFATSVLAHAQIALQHAYALDRLGVILRRDGARQLKPQARLEWSQMVARHAAAAATELEGLGRQLDTMFPDVTETPAAEQKAIAIGIDDPLGFWRAASALRVEAQSVNEQVVDLFAGSKAELSIAQVRSAVGRLRDGLPIAQTGQMQAFANRLAHASDQNELGEMHRR